MESGTRKGPDTRDALLAHPHPYEQIDKHLWKNYLPQLLMRLVTSHGRAGRWGGLFGIPLLQLTANCLTRMKREKPPGKTVSIA